jgi:hypothetical protein
LGQQELAQGHEEAPIDVEGVCVPCHDESSAAAVASHELALRPEVRAADASPGLELDRQYLAGGPLGTKSTSWKGDRRSSGSSRSRGE